MGHAGRRESGWSGVAAGQELPPIVIGSDLAETLGAMVGDKVMVTSPHRES
jgi:lipoprotein-releasing system permease protein